MKTNVKAIMKSSVGRAVTATVCRTALIGLLVLGLSTIGNRAGLTRTAQAQDEKQSGANKSAKHFKCSNAMIAGRFATRGDGFVPSGPPPAPMVPFAEVGLMTLDDGGTLTHDVTVSNNGLILRDVDHGTYTVNKDCKGTMTINIPVPPFQLNFDLVVADGGEEFYIIGTTPSVVTVGAKRLE
jgi:hypothetical protein